MELVIFIAVIICSDGIPSHSMSYTYNVKRPKSNEAGSISGEHVGILTLGMDFWSVAGKKNSELQGRGNNSG